MKKLKEKSKKDLVEVDLVEVDEDQIEEEVDEVDEVLVEVEVDQAGEVLVEAEALEKEKVFDQEIKIVHSENLKIQDDLKIKVVVTLQKEMREEDKDLQLEEIVEVAEDEVVSQDQDNKLKYFNI